MGFGFGVFRNLPMAEVAVTRKWCSEVVGPRPEYQIEAGRVNRVMIEPLSRLFSLIESRFEEMNGSTLMAVVDWIMLWLNWPLLIYSKNDLEQSVTALDRF